MSLRRSVALGLGLALLAPLAAPGGAGASPAVDATVAGAETWLLTQQQADGGFEVAGFPGFETPDATLALAASLPDRSRRGTPPAPCAAIEAPRQRRRQGPARRPRQAGRGQPGDRQARRPTPPTTPAPPAPPSSSRSSPAPLGISATDFDPSGDSATAGRPARRAQRPQAGRRQLRPRRPVQRRALRRHRARTRSARRSPPASSPRSRPRSAPEGSWDYTGHAGQRVRRHGRRHHRARPHRPALGRARHRRRRRRRRRDLARLAAAGQRLVAGVRQRRPQLHLDGLDGAERPADRHGHGRPGAPRFGTPATGTYVGPEAWLRTQQADDGHITSPNEVGEFGTNTFATTQTIQALSRQWFLTDEREPP